MEKNVRPIKDHSKHLQHMKRAFRKIKPPKFVFLDSGAFGLYTRNRDKKNSPQKHYSSTKKFKRYVDEYAEFVKKHIAGIDFYANVDVMFNPERSWFVLKYLEEYHGLNPVPVIHSSTKLKWVEKHLDAGYKFIGLGGGGFGRGKNNYLNWADQVFNMICPKSNDYLPTVRVHGFALTAYNLMIRYPWWSIDSTSWVQAAAWGSIYVPHKRGGEFVFTESPYNMAFSMNSPAVKKGAEHYLKCSAKEKAILLEWLDLIGVPIGLNGEWGVCSEHNARKVANLRFFEMMMKSLPQWPVPFYPKMTRREL